MQFKKILIPIDGSSLSLKSLEALKSLFSKDDVKVIILNVIKLVGEIDCKEMSLIMAQDVNFLKDNSTNRLEEAKNLIPDYDVELVMKVGTPYKEIIKYAKENDVDLIIMTKTGDGFVDKYIVGSVTKRVVNNYTKPVLVV